MKVLVIDRSISTSQGILRGGDEADLPEAEVKKIMVMKPNAFEVLKADPKPAKKVAKKKASAKKTKVAAKPKTGVKKAKASRKKSATKKVKKKKAGRGRR